MTYNFEYVLIIGDIRGSGKDPTEELSEGCALESCRCRRTGEPAGLGREAPFKLANLRGFLFSAGTAGHFPELTMPIAIMAGLGDKIVDSNRQARRLGAELPQSRRCTVPDAGHMIHHIVPE